MGIRPTEEVRVERSGFHRSEVTRELDFCEIDLCEMDLCEVDLCNDAQ